jgi:hypothetical protein
MTAEYTSIRTSSWDVDALVNKLNEHATQGWRLVTVVNTGSDLAAVLTRGDEPAPAVVAAPTMAEVVPAIVEDAPTTVEAAPAPEVPMPVVTAEPVVVVTVSEPVVVATAPEPVVVPEPVAPTPVEEPAGWGAVSEAMAEAQPVIAPVVVPEVVVPEVVVPEPVVVVEPTPAPAAPTPEAPPQPVSLTPAGWYPDPSGRFEMRYWDGTAWTEHVARGGQQFTDPPVA